MPINNAITRWLAERIERRVRHTMVSRGPDFIVGGRETPYLNRWWLIPRNRMFNVYLHEFIRSDDDRALHDHPFASLSIALTGEMREIYLDRSNASGGKGVVERDRGVRFGSVIYRGAKFAHRMVVPPTGATTLFLTGPRIREWGFHCPRGWVHWKDFTSSRDRGATGKGCE